MKLVEAPVTQPRVGQVLLRVEACGVFDRGSIFTSLKYLI
jgi:NADPH:quinone reductase-like Zn-dependent oxidoreductase